MTDPRNHGFWLDPFELPDERALQTWLAEQAAAGRTERSDLIRRWQVVTMRRPIPPAPFPLTPGDLVLDTNHWVQVNDWEAVKAAGYKAVYAKISQGTDFMDPKARDTHRRASAAGLWVGFFHYFEHDKDGGEQARWFSQCLGEVPGNLTPAVDFEVAGQLRLPLKPKAFITDNLWKFKTYIEDVGFKPPVFYSNDDSVQQMTTRPAWLAEMPLWCADWTPPLNVPAPWTWARIWQKGKRPVPGAENEIDWNVWQGLAPGDPPPPDGPKHTMANRTNQFVINLFDQTFGGFVVLGLAIPNWVTTMVGLGNVNRPKLYTGPAIEDMPITQAQKGALIAKLEATP